MAFVSGVKCRECGRESPADPLNVCDFCFGPLEVVYDYATISEVVSRDRIAAGPLSIWRYGELLPADSDRPVNIMAGYTPLIKAGNSGKRLDPTPSASSRRRSSPATCSRCGSSSSILGRSRRNRRWPRARRGRRLF